MNRREIIDRYFIENRIKLLDIAAFLDRLRRGRDPADAEDFRMKAFREALRALGPPEEAGTKNLQMIFSDPTAEPIEKIQGSKGTSGAYERNGESE